MLSHIVATSENNVIGSANELPWSLPNDFRYFKNKTWGMPVIMGRHTYESLRKSLPGRINIVVTRNLDWNPGDVFVTNNIDEAIEKAKESDAKEIFIIGGGEIFKETMNKIARIYLTRVHAVVDGDTFYPEMKAGEWKKTDARSFPSDEKHGYAYTFEIWERNHLNS